eukprot:gene11887-14991_t
MEEDIIEAPPGSFAEVQEETEKNSFSLFVCRTLGLPLSAADLATAPPECSVADVKIEVVTVAKLAAEAAAQEKRDP